MKTSIVFIASKSDPNGLEQLKTTIQRTLENTSKNTKIVIISEGSNNLLKNFPEKFK